MPEPITDPITISVSSRNPNVRARVEDEPEAEPLTAKWVGAAQRGSQR